MRFITVTLSLFAVITTLSGCERTKQTSEKNLLKKWVGISHLKVNLELVEYSIMAEPVIPGSRTTLIPVARAIYSIV